MVAAVNKISILMEEMQIIGTYLAILQQWWLIYHLHPKENNQTHMVPLSTMVHLSVPFS